MLQSNYLIINKKPRKFASMKLAGRTAVFVDQDGRPIDFGVLPLADSVYAMMSCDRIHLIMMVTDRRGEHDVIGVFWKDETDYAEDRARLVNAVDIRLYKRDLKINSYAWSIAEKLNDGIRIKLTDTVDGSNMTVCPECGTLNPKETPYCLECGSELE